MLDSVSKRLVVENRKDRASRDIKFQRDRSGGDAIDRDWMRFVRQE